MGKSQSREYENRQTNKVSNNFLIICTHTSAKTSYQSSFSNPSKDNICVLWKGIATLAVHYLVLFIKTFFSLAFHVVSGVVLG